MNTKDSIKEVIKEKFSQLSKKELSLIYQVYQRVKKKKKSTAKEKSRGRE